jgi:hypothetical protein
MKQCHCRAGRSLSVCAAVREKGEVEGLFRGKAGREAAVKKRLTSPARVLYLEHVGTM